MIGVVELPPAMGSGLSVPKGEERRGLIVLGRDGVIGGGIMSDVADPGDGPPPPRLVVDCWKVAGYEPKHWKDLNGVTSVIVTEEAVVVAVRDTLAGFTQFAQRLVQVAKAEKAGAVDAIRAMTESLVKATQ